MAWRHEEMLQSPSPVKKSNSKSSTSGAGLSYYDLSSIDLSGYYEESTVHEEDKICDVYSPKLGFIKKQPPSYHANSPSAMIRSVMNKKKKEKERKKGVSVVKNQDSFQYVYNTFMCFHICTKVVYAHMILPHIYSYIYIKVFENVQKEKNQVF